MSSWQLAQTVHLNMDLHCCYIFALFPGLLYLAYKRLLNTHFNENKLSGDFINSLKDRKTKTKKRAMFGGKEGTTDKNSLGANRSGTVDNWPVATSVPCGYATQEAQPLAKAAASMRPRKSDAPLLPSVLATLIRCSAMCFFSVS